MRLDIDNEQNFITHAVGTQFYTQNLKSSFDSCNPKGNRAILKVTLIQEKNNPYDKNAVGIYSDFGLIGHLSRQHAILYRKQFKGKHKQTVMATILNRSYDTYLDYRLYVDLTYTHEGQYLREKDIEYLQSYKPRKNKSISSYNQSQNTVVDIPDYLDGNIRTNNNDKPPSPPPKPWKQQSVIEKIFTIVAYVITTVIVLVVLAVALAILYTICSFLIYAFKVFFL